MALIRIQPSRNGNALWCVYLVVVLDCLGMGLVSPVLPSLIMEMSGGDIAASSRDVGIITAVWAVMQFLFAPISGALSDRYGRRVVILLSLLGMAVSYLVLALATSIELLLLGRMLSGMASSSAMTAAAFVADASAPEERIKNFGVLGASFAAGFVLGPVLGGLLGSYDLRAPFWTACIVTFSIALGVYLFLDNVRAPARAGEKIVLRELNPILSLSILTKSGTVLTCAAIVLLSNFAQASLLTIWPQYTHSKLNWTTSDVGWSLGILSLGTVVVQMVVVRIFAKWIGEQSSVFVGLCCGALGYFLIARATSSVWIYMGITVFWIIGLVGPCLQGIMARHIEADEQGRLQGSIGALTSIATFLGPFVFSEIFARSMTSWRSDVPTGIAFDIAAVIMVLAAIISLRTQASFRFFRLQASSRLTVHDAENG